MFVTRTCHRRKGNNAFRPLSNLVTALLADACPCAPLSLSLHNCSIPDKYTHMHLCMYTHTCTYVCTHTHMHLCMYTHRCTYVCTHTHMHIYMHTLFGKRETRVLNLQRSKEHTVKYLFLPF